MIRNLHSKKPTKGEQTLSNEGQNDTILDHKRNSNKFSVA